MAHKTIYYFIIIAFMWKIGLINGINLIILFAIFINLLIISNNKLIFFCNLFTFAWFNLLIIYIFLYIYFNVITAML